MAVAVVQEGADGGGDTSNYDAIHQRLMAADTMPDGFVMHTAGATEDGGFRVFEVWESRADFDRFVQERLMPILAELGAGDAPQPSIASYELHEVVMR